MRVGSETNQVCAPGLTMYDLSERSMGDCPLLELSRFRVDVAVRLVLLAAFANARPNQASEQDDTQSYRASPNGMA